MFFEEGGKPQQHVVKKDLGRVQERAGRRVRFFEDRRS